MGNPFLRAKPSNPAQRTPRLRDRFVALRAPRNDGRADRRGRLNLFPGHGDQWARLGDPP